MSHTFALIVALISTLNGVAAFVNTRPAWVANSVTSMSAVSRRDALSIAIGWAGGAAVALADDEAVESEPAKVYPEIPVSKDRMAGQLEAYADVGKGWRILKPYSWNQFEQNPGVYEMKWVDLVASNKQEIVLTTTPVKSTTVSVDKLGEVKAVGEKLASARDAKLIDASAATKEGILFYMFEFKTDKDVHELYQLCVAKGKLWSLDATCPEKRWDKVGEQLKKSLLSFMPNLAK